MANLDTSYVLMMDAWLKLIFRGKSSPQEHVKAKSLFGSV